MTKGDAIGSRSVLLPVLVIVVALIVSGVVGSSYGIAISALGMLGFVGATVSIDAFGPIADNAGGLAEACHLNAKVRVITDKRRCWQHNGSHRQGICHRFSCFCHSIVDNGLCWKLYCHRNASFP